MAFLQPQTANITPHPAPVAPLADESREGSVAVEQASVTRFPPLLGGSGGAGGANIPKQLQHI